MERRHPSVRDGEATAGLDGEADGPGGVSDEADSLKSTSRSQLQSFREETKSQEDAISLPRDELAAQGTDIVVGSEYFTDISFDQKQHAKPPPSCSRNTKQSLLAKMYQNKNTEAIKVREESRSGSNAVVARASKRVHPDESTRELSSECLQPTTSSTSMTDLLHNSCKLYSSTLAVIESALMFDAEAIRKAVPTTAAIQINTTQTKVKRKRVSDTYAYPINIAICSGGSADVIELLAKTGPDVLLLKDGPYDSSPLAIAIRHQSGLAVLQVLLAADRKQSEVMDNQNNLPLHVAVQGQLVSIEVVKLIYEAFTDAIKATNIRAETPVQVAERNPHCPERIVDLLHDYAYSHHEDAAVHIDDDEL
jgi:hypothetical protein